jgi:cell division protein FtsW
MKEYKDVATVMNNQIKWIVLGLFIILAMNLFNYHWYKKLLIPMMAVLFLALVYVKIMGESRNNAQRTLFEGGSVQPSEFAMLAMIIYLSFWLVSKQEVLNKMAFGLVPMGFILGIYAGLIFWQPDLSATLTLLILGALLFVLAGADLRQILIILAVGILVIILLVLFSDTGRTRIDQFIKGFISPAQASDHIQLAIPAIVSGGWFGVGIGRGSAKFEGMPYPWTDSIFAVIIEEIGIIGAVLIVLLYVLFMWRGLTIAKNAPDLLGRLLAAGVTFWISFDAFINMGVIVNLFPFAGNALPFISAGGSSMVSSLMGIGLLMNIARVSKQQAANSEGRSFGAVVDMRRRDRGGRVSRSLGSEGTRD